MGIPRTAQSSLRDWVAEHTDRIELHFLPSYSPQLNPVELLNHDVEANAVGRKRARSLTQLKENVTDYMNGREKQPHIIKRFFAHPCTAYAAA
jgi:transposase